jgi:hypothetical protein
MERSGLCTQREAKRAGEQWDVSTSLDKGGRVTHGLKRDWEWDRVMQGIIRHDIKGTERVRRGRGAKRWEDAHQATTTSVEVDAGAADAQREL